VALEILYMRLFSDRLAQRNRELELIEVGRELLQHVTFRRNNQQDHVVADIVNACLADPDAGPMAAAVAMRLRRAVAAHETYSFHNDDVLEALLQVQPAAVLDALFSGEEVDQQVGVSLFQPLGRHRSNPLDVISCEALIAWCEEDRASRYPLAASIITFAHRPDATGPQVWSEQARALLANAPDTKSLLAVLIRRFRPMSWSGSRAAVIEVNGQLLDSVQAYVPSALMPFVGEAKAQLAQEIARERQWETEKDRARDERFE
jgi:hypothetical protein